MCILLMLYVKKALYIVVCWEEAKACEKYALKYIFIYIYLKYTHLVTAKKNLTRSGNVGNKKEKNVD